MRWTREVNLAWRGDFDVASAYLPAVRQLLGMLDNQRILARDALGTRSLYRALEDGTTVYVRIDGPIASAWIDTTLSRGVPLPAFQYMYSLRGAGATPAPTVLNPDGNVVVMGAWVGILVIPNNVEPATIISVPLVSTRNDVQPVLGDGWEYIEVTTENYDTTYPQIVDKLLIPRYEVAMAEAKHLYQPNSSNIVHAPWVQKGIAPYNAYAWTKAAQSLTGKGAGANASNLLNFSMQYVQGFNTTDIGYETDLAVYEQPLVESETPVAGNSRGGAPDADWYTSYARVVVDGREFGVLIDADQKLYVWPTAAEGTDDTTGSPYLSQSIKTSVDALYVQEHQIVFPSAVYYSSVAHRDEVSEDPVGTGPLGVDSARYTWVPRSDGLQFATIGVKYSEMPAPDTVPTAAFFFGYEPDFSSGGTAPPSSERPYRVVDAVPLTLDFQITVTGPNLEDFEISVGQAMEVATPDEFYPLKVGYSGPSGFTGTQDNELLVAGIRAYYTSETRPFELPSASGPYGQVNCVAGNHAWGFRREPLGPGGLRGQTAYHLHDWNRYVGYGSNATARQWIYDMGLEAQFAVYSPRLEADVYAVCCRRNLTFPAEGRPFGQFFTAELIDIDLRYGVVAVAANYYEPPADFGPTEDSATECGVTKGVFVYRRNQKLYEWTQDAGLEANFAYEPAGLPLQKTELRDMAAHTDGKDNFNGDYVGFLFTEAGEPPSLPSFRVSGAPFGLEAYAYLRTQHFASGYFLGGLLVDANIVSLVGKLFYLENGRITTIPNTNQLVDPNTILCKEIDFLQLSDVTTTHKAQWESAFERTIDTDMTLRLESQDVSLNSDTTYRNKLIVGDNSGDALEISIDEPQFWFSAGWRKSRASHWGLYPFELNNPTGDAKIRRETQTLLDPTFGGRAYGYTRTE